MLNTGVILRVFLYIVCMFCTIIKFAKLSNGKLISNHTPKILEAKMDDKSYVTMTLFKCYVQNDKSLYIFQIHRVMIYI